MNRLSARVPLLLVGLIGACSGKARLDAPFTGDTAGTAPSSAGSSSGGVGGSAGRGSSGGSSTAGSTPMACLEPVAPTGASNCDFNSYAFDVASGYCAYFVKSNCAVTSNRFDTFEACIAACDPGGLEHCVGAGDCVLQSVSCCGGCEPVKAEDLRALNRNYADVNTCPGVACGTCATYDGEPERPYFGARCTNQQCELFDVRNTEITRCDSDNECVLREGLECCQCGTAGAWVAVNKQQILTANFLGCAPGGCPVCDYHAPADDLKASCVGGRCVVSKAER